MPLISAQTLINNALTNLGILEQGGVPSASDAAEGLIRLNYLLGQWRIQNKYVWSVASTLWPLVANTGTYTIGVGGAFNGPRPTFIEQAYISFLGPGGNLITSSLDLITAKEYNDIADLSATAELPEMLYYDHASPLATLALYPRPRCTVASNLELVTWAQLGSFANLAATIDLPDGYAEAISNALGVRLLSMFGVAVNAQVATLVSGLAKQAEASIVELNSAARRLQLAPPAAATEGQAPQQ